jgi:hypothetical protein
MKISSFFTALYLSFVSRGFYQSVAMDKSNRAIAFLFVLCAFCALPLHCYSWYKVASVDISAIRAVSVSDEVFKDNSSDFIKHIIMQMPVMELSKGNISLSEDQPVIIKHPTTGKDLAIIDVNAKENDYKDSPAIMLISKNTISLRYIAPEPISFYISKIFNPKDDVLIIDHNEIIDRIDLMRKILLWVIPLMVFPMNSGLNFVYCLVKTLFYTIAGVILFKMWKLEPDIKTIFKLAAVSSAPSIVVRSMLGMLVGSVIPFELFDMIIFAFSAGYFYFAIKSYQMLKLQNH